MKRLKTHDELLTSGWTSHKNGTYEPPPTSEDSWLAKQMFEDYGTERQQSGWTWTPGMFIEDSKGSNDGDLVVSPTGAKKFSGGKTQMSLIPLDLLDGTARVLARGADKYGRNNYRNGFPPTDLIDSLLRHVTALQKCVEANPENKEMPDPDSGEAEIHHIVCNALFLVDSLRKDGWKV